VESIASTPELSDVSRTKPVNPFYAVLVVAGATFALTATMYGVMTVRSLDARAAEPTGVIAFMEQHGATLMIIELIVLAALTFAAIGTDDYWMRGAAKNEGNEKVG
jgi:hypothetical protein